jgi:hypothetical protein
MNTRFVELFSSTLELENVSISGNGGHGIFVRENSYIEAQWGTTVVTGNSGTGALSQRNSRIDFGGHAGLNIQGNAGGDMRPETLSAIVGYGGGRRASASPRMRTRCAPPDRLSVRVPPRRAWAGARSLVEKEHRKNPERRTGMTSPSQEMNRRSNAQVHRRAMSRAVGGRCRRVTSGTRCAGLAIDDATDINRPVAAGSAAPDPSRFVYICGVVEVRHGGGESQFRGGGILVSSHLVPNPHPGVSSFNHKGELL